MYQPCKRKSSGEREALHELALIDINLNLKFESGNQEEFFTQRERRGTQKKQMRKRQEFLPRISRRTQINTGAEKSERAFRSLSVLSAKSVVRMSFPALP